jgi:PadR family transcriptional regulator, regulatory protein PadR
MDSPTNDEDANLVENLRIELRSGCLAVAAMSQLKQEHYGYTLRKALEDVGLGIEESTLYPLLRRLESQGLLVSEWREEGRRKKRFYKLSARGERVLEKLLVEWSSINLALLRLIGKAA